MTKKSFFKNGIVLITYTPEFMIIKANKRQVEPIPSAFTMAEWLIAKLGKCLPIEKRRAKRKCKKEILKTNSW